MIRRIFIAIALPEQIKEEIARIQSGYNLPVTWVKPENLHITLLFLGAVRADRVSQISLIVEKIAARHKPFSLFFGRIGYGPDSSIPPRLVWLEGEHNGDFENLKKDIDQALKKKNLYYLSGQTSDIKIHVTLGRIKQWEWSKVSPEERESVDQNTSFQLSVNEILIMESKLSPGRPPKYLLLQKINLER